MIKIRKSSDRGHANHGWLDSYHSFSFADYYDANHLGFSTLRVINEDRIAPGGGFGTHPHRDMEIVTYVLAGALEHRDSMGNGEVLRPGELQRMSAGTGIEHSEFNPSKTDPVHLLQIWIRPKKPGLTPSYEQKSFADKLSSNRITLVAHPEGKDGALRINTDASIHVGRVEAGGEVAHKLAEGRSAWVQVTQGAVTLNGKALATGDGAAITKETELNFNASEWSEFLLFDLV